MELINMRFRYTNGRNSDFISLCHSLDSFLNEVVGGEEKRAKYVPYNSLDDINDVIVVYDGGNAIGCASFKKYNAECAEVKRVFIKKEYRNQGLSRALMKKLEGVAKNQGYTSLILESGELLVSAMSLYRHIGYVVIPNYGQYKDMADSICMKKKL